MSLFQHCVYHSDGVVIRLLNWLKPTTPIPILRTQLYYFVCILFRLAIYNIVFILRNEWYIPILVGLCSIVAILHLSSTAFQKNQKQWWSKKFQFIMSVLILIGCVATYQKIIPTIIVPMLLYFSIIGGLYQRWTCCCQVRKSS